MRMLLEAGRLIKRMDMVKTRLEKKMKIPGFGHRVYHTDGSARYPLERAFRGTRQTHRPCGSLPDLQPHREVHEGNQEVSTRTSISTRHPLTIRWGFPIDLFTPIFAVSRMSGWTAHVLEQYRNNRLIRPRAEYIGDTCRPALGSHR